MKNEKEFTALAEKYMDMVYRIALNVVRQPADAEDVTQNVLLRLYRSGPVFENEDHERYWLIRVTANEAKRLVSLPHRRRETGLDEVLEDVFLPEDSVHRQMLQAVMALPAKYRLPVYLHYYEGYAVREIGEILGRKESTVQSQLARGREKLKAALKEEE